MCAHVRLAKRVFRGLEVAQAIEKLATGSSVGHLNGSVEPVKN